MTRACAVCDCWDRDSVSRNARSCAPEERHCLLGPLQVAKRPDDFCHSFRPIEVGHDSRRAKS